MDTKLKNALIIIAVIIGAYYLISPYENCMREHKTYLGSDKAMKTADKRYHCSYVTDW